MLCQFPECTELVSHNQHIVNQETTPTDEELHHCLEYEKSFSQSDHPDHTKKPSTKHPSQYSEQIKSSIKFRYLAEHVKLHTEKKPYECSECSKSFAGKKSLARHMRSHEREKAHRPMLLKSRNTNKCLACKVLFTNSNQLSTHMKEHRGETQQFEDYTIMTFKNFNYGGDTSEANSLKSSQCKVEKHEESLEIKEENNVYVEDMEQQGDPLALDVDPLSLDTDPLAYGTGPNIKIDSSEENFVDTVKEK